MHTLPVLNIATYRFFRVEEPEALAQQLREHLKGLEIKGTILLAQEGINLFLAGTPLAITAFRQFVERPEMPEALRSLDYKESWSETIPFKRLKIKVKPEIVTFRQPDLSPAIYRSPSVTPQELKNWLDTEEDVILLDTRNTFEFERGAFAGAMHLGNDDFCEFAESVKTLPEDIKHKKVVTFCTGGIRCEKAAPFMEHHGFKNVYQLEGGILRYFEHIGRDHYEGECFVFDERRTVDSELQAKS
ncbi:MAG: rhodanese-like domain-containing protein [Pseudomonadota bacterium]